MSVLGRQLLRRRSSLARRGLTGAVVVVLAFAACSNSSSKQSTDTSRRDLSTSATTTTRPGRDDVDDLNQDGEPDKTCGTADFKAGLVLGLLCDGAAYASEPSEGTTLVKGSLYSLPSIGDDLKGELLSDVSANAIAARDPSGKRVYVFFIQSDTLFGTGAATLSDPAMETLGVLARRLQARWPGATIQVRGHTDATGSPATNQRLSEQRAANVAAFLVSHGIDTARVTSVGLGSTVPVAVEDGEPGRRENRRVELVVRV